MTAAPVAAPTHPQPVTSTNTEETRMSDTPRYAVIHVKPTPNSDAWPIVERTYGGGWQSGSHHYPDAEVLDVRPLNLVPVPRVWLPGDTVPSGVWVLDAADGVTRTPDAREVVARTPLVEVFVPDFVAVVAAEQARRAADELTVHDAAAGLYDGEAGA